VIIEIIGYIISVSLAHIIPPFVAVPLELVAAGRYGLIPAIVYTIAGNTLGAFVAFYIARVFGWPIIEFLFKENEVKRARGIAAKYTFWHMTWSRMVFASFYDVLSYISGLSSVSPGKFIISTVISTVPSVILIVGFGNQIDLNFAYTVWVTLGILVVSIFLILRKVWISQHDVVSKMKKE
jgi:uncharacterized membrane protein YdjX (TVP38/TMEM64 family)